MAHILITNSEINGIWYPTVFDQVGITSRKLSSWHFLIITIKPIHKLSSNSRQCNMYSYGIVVRVEQLKFGEFLLPTFWWNKVWQNTQGTLTLEIYSLTYCTGNKLNRGAYIRNLAKYWMAFSLTISPKFVKFVKLSKFPDIRYKHYWHKYLPGTFILN